MISVPIAFILMGLVSGALGYAIAYCSQRNKLNKLSSRFEQLRIAYQAYHVKYQDLWAKHYQR